MPTRRQLRVNNLLQEEISQIIRTEIRDPDVGFTTITGVEVSADLQQAYVYTSVMGDEAEARATIAALSRARRMIRSELGDRIQLKHIPKLIFELDETARHAQRIETLISKFESEVEQESTTAPREEDPGGSADYDFSSTIAQIARLLKEGHPTTIFIHHNPDGDAVGSGLALSLALQQLGQSVPVVCADPVPRRYEFLPATDRISSDVPEYFKVAVVLDAADYPQLGDLAAGPERAETVVWIDHHRSGQGGGDIDYLDRTAAATALLIRRVIEALGAEVTADIATCLYTALATDTGFFTFENTSAQALEAATALVEAGADPHAIAAAARDQYRLPALRLQGKALVSIASEASGRIVHAALTPGDFAAAQADTEDTEGIIDLLRTAAGGEVQVLFKAASHNHWRVSLRSSVVDVATIAGIFGGGGHTAAAGCSMTGSLPEVCARMMNAIVSVLDREQ